MRRDESVFGSSQGSAARFLSQESVREIFKDMGLTTVKARFDIYIYI